MQQRRQAKPKGGLMAKLRLATFNVENLFARYKFRSNFDASVSDGFTANDMAFDIYEETEKRITAQAIKKVDADIIALQEVESLPILDTFVSRYLPNMGYKHRGVFDAFDPRYIDVAIASRYPISSICSHRNERNKKNTAWLFSRDCLEVTVDVDGTPLLIYINHLKSMMEGRDETHDRRQEQAERVAAIVDARWKQVNYVGNFAVVGDMNDYPEGKTALNPLLKHPELENVVARRAEDDTWTHYYKGEDAYRQLDFIFLPKPLAQKNAAAPEIMREGLPWRASKYTGSRLDDVGEDNPKASDHAPVYMDLKLL
jgi:endonuclease/exonuclease/phosphatase family metal-dependent hydrolase